MRRLVRRGGGEGGGGSPGLYLQLQNYLRSLGGPMNFAKYALATRPTVNDAGLDDPVLAR